MPVLHATARPEKRLFINLITRDISLIDAFLDLIDNSINAALEPIADDLKTADDYQRLLSNSKMKPKVKIAINVGSARISIEDNAAGISAEMARTHVFKFGRETDEAEESDRLSVYGIGLKRAMFKCGNRIHMASDHREGGFKLDLNVRKWAKKDPEDEDKPWTFDIETRPPEKIDTGTQIVITELHDDVIRRIGDGLFFPQLRDRISRTYSLFIGRVVEITVNNQVVPKEPLDIGKNFGNERFRADGVTCTITAGFASGSAEGYRDRNAGWYVFCNGRGVLFADKSTTTGWGGAGLPIFQPKHRPFLGMVFFVSADPEKLPWTTTKASVNEENIAWQEAKRRMVTVGRSVLSFLDKRYTEEGTTFSPADLQDATQGKVGLLQAAVAKQRNFSPPKRPPPKEIRIQYMAKVADIDRITNHLRRPAMSGSDVGRYTFKYFLENEVGSKD